MIRTSLAGAAGLLLLGASAHAQTTVPGYSVSTFATGSAISVTDKNGKPAKASNVDSLAVYGGNVFAGYANDSDSAGAFGSSTIAQYTTGGTLVKTYTLAGGNDGLRVDPSTGLLWILQNQDGSPVLNVLNPGTGAISQYGFTGNPNQSYSGYDDVVFSGGKAYLSATNPASSTDTVIYAASSTLPAAGGNLALTSVLQAGSLVDTDSLALSPDGKLLLDDQGGAPLGTAPLPSLTIVSNPGTGSQTTSVVFPKDVTGAPVSVDDTRFAPAGSTELLIADTKNNTIYALTGPFAAGQAFTATKGKGFVGSLDLGSGVITPVVSGLGSPHGLAFIPAAAPEPSAFAGLALGALSLGGLTLRAKKRSVNA